MFDTVQKYSISCLVICFSFIARANDLTLSLVSFENYENQTIKIDLNLNWQNSWNKETGAVNHDGAWVFLKTKSSYTPDWKRVTIDSVFSEDYNFFVSEDSIGFLVKSNATEIDKISSGLLTLFFKTSDEHFNIYIGGIEVVLVDSGSFSLGDAISFNSFESSLSEPVLIKSEQGLKFGDDISSTTYESVSGDIPGKYPKGFNAFYMMKYEISQRQFVDFLNHITYQEQQKVLINPQLLSGSPALYTGTNNFFNGLILKQSGSEIENIGGTYICDLNKNGVANDLDDGETLACNFLSWLQLLYYLDWVGMRPMTEFEFEKACRGPLNVVSREFAFGTNLVTDANDLKHDSTESETYITSLINGYGIAAHGYLGRSGPLRVGFAANKNTDRLSSGASYWGIMELSGNLWEQTVGVSKPNGLLFEGSHGDGDLSNLPIDWKLKASIFRGGAWSSGVFGAFRDLAVSDRYYYDLESEVARNTTGGRGVISLSKLKEYEY